MARGEDIYCQELLVEVFVLGLQSRLVGLVAWCVGSSSLGLDLFSVVLLEGWLEK